MEKATTDYFADWEADTFGFGYGTGEEHTIPALQSLLCACPDKGNYDYKTLETELSPPVAWLLINALCRADIIEYGTSPRYGWLTGKGRRLREHMLSWSPDELIRQTARDENYTHCDPNACNCGPGGYEEGRVCQNPFWLDI